MWPSTPGLAASIARSHPSASRGPSLRRIPRATPAARGLAGPGKATAGFLGLTGGLGRLRDLVRQSPEDVKAPDLGWSLREW